MKKKQLNITRLLAIIVILLFITYFNLFIFAPKTIPIFLRLGVPRTPFNILIIGTDINYNAETKQPMPELNARADTIILVHIDPLHSRLNVISLPRDSYVSIPTKGMNRINAANALGGIDLTMKTVSKFTSTKIDYYLLLKPTLIPKIVDVVGGISLNVAEDMFYTDHAQKLAINLKKGWQKLDGKRAHEYIRFRHDVMGDIGRVSRQQVFLNALTKAITKPTNIIKAPYVLNSILSNIETNLSPAQAIRIINFMRLAKLKTVTIPGEPATIPYVGSVWILDTASLEAAVKELF